MHEADDVMAPPIALNAPVLGAGARPEPSAVAHTAAEHGEVRRTKRATAGCIEAPPGAATTWR